MGAYAISFGAVSVAAGLNVLQAQALSALMFTGASQFAFVGVVAAGGGLVAAVVTAWLLGLRNGLYGLHLATVLSPPGRPSERLRGWRRMGAAQFTIDESTAMALAYEGDPAATRRAFWATGWSVFVLWNLGTLLGAVGAASLSDPKVLGLDAAIPAGFLALLWPRLVDRSTWALAVASGVLALALAPVLRPGMPVLAGAGLAVAGALWLTREALLMWPAVLVASLGLVRHEVGWSPAAGVAARAAAREQGGGAAPDRTAGSAPGHPDVLVADGIRDRRPRGWGGGRGRGADAPRAVPGGRALGGGHGRPAAGGGPGLSGRAESLCASPVGGEADSHLGTRSVEDPRHGQGPGDRPGGRLLAGADTRDEVLHLVAHVVRGLLAGEVARRPVAQVQSDAGRHAAVIEVHHPRLAGDRRADPARRDLGVQAGHLEAVVAQQDRALPVDSGGQEVPGRVDGVRVAEQQQ